MENYITAKEVAAMVKLTEQTIRRYVMLKQIPFHKIIRAVRFKPSEIQKWVEEKNNGHFQNQKNDKSTDLFDVSVDSTLAGGKYD